jgi:hypothetical protein
MHHDGDQPPMSDDEIHAIFVRLLEKIGNRRGKTELGEKTLRAVELFVGGCMLVLFKEIDRANANSTEPPPSREP